MTLHHINFSTQDKQQLDILKSQTKLNKPTPAIDFRNFVVNKPWGYEYLMYSNDHVEIWSLHIKPGASTSKHCHPNKKTALIVLSGAAEFSTLENSLQLEVFDCALIEPGVFHATKALSAEGIHILEVETPPAKHDLVRLNDRYGRTGQGYEGVDKMSFDDGECIRFFEPDLYECITHQYHGLRLGVVKLGSALTDQNRQYFVDHELSIILNGEIVDKFSQKLTVGDVLHNKNLETLNNLLEVENLTLMNISRYSD